MNFKNKKKILSIFIISLLFIINIDLLPFVKSSCNIILNFKKQSPNFLVILSNEVEEINQLIPDNARVSFISPIPTDYVFENLNSTRDFYIIQFLIVPHLLDNNLDNEYAIGLFSPELLNSINYKQYNFEIIKITPGGLYLFKRKATL
ncbi:MAG: hypothetical protein WC197_08600 [Candidatus Gastranaerophilaceae bacterium]|jgi:hypothetical protein